MLWTNNRRIPNKGSMTMTHRKSFDHGTVFVCFPRPLLVRMQGETCIFVISFVRSFFLVFFCLFLVGAGA